MDKTLLLRARVTGQNALLSLNGMILSKLRNGHEFMLPVHEFIQSGENRIQVVSLTQSESSGETCLLGDDCTVQIWVELQKDRGPKALVVPQILFEWSVEFKKGERLNKGRLLDVLVDLPVSFPRWRYLDVISSSHGELDVMHIQDFLLKLLGVFKMGKSAALLPYFSVRNRELAAAYGLDLQSVHADFTNHLQVLCTQADLIDSVSDPQSWLFQPVRASSVYALLNKAHEPLLQWGSQQTGLTYQLPMHVGVLGGEVFVLR